MQRPKVNVDYKMRKLWARKKRAREKGTGIRELVAQASSGIRHLNRE